MTAFMAFLQAAIGLVLAAAGVAKVGRTGPVERFLIAAGFGLTTARSAALTLPAVELALGAWLVAGVFPTLGSLLAVALTIGFVAVQLVVRRRGVAAPCRCFGVLDAHESSMLVVGRSIALAAATAVLAVSQFTAAAVPDPFGEISARLLGALVGAGLVIAVAVSGQILLFESRRPRALTGAATPD